MSEQRKDTGRTEARFRGQPGSFLCPAGFPVPEGTEEWAVVKGDKGDKGERGEQGMSAGARRSVIYLFILALALSGANLLWTSHAVNASHAAQQRQAATERAIQEHAGLLVERKLCTDLLTMARIPPPSGDPAQNPSRAYEQAEHRAWSGLASAIGCKAARP